MGYLSVSTTCLILPLFSGIGLWDVTRNDGKFAATYVPGWNSTRWSSGVADSEDTVPAETASATIQAEQHVQAGATGDTREPDAARMDDLTAVLPDVMQRAFKSEVALKYMSYGLAAFILEGLVVLGLAGLWRRCRRTQDTEGKAADEDADKDEAVAEGEDEEKKQDADGDEAADDASGETHQEADAEEKEEHDSARPNPKDSGDTEAVAEEQINTAAVTGGA